VKLYEYQAVGLLAAAGIPVPEGSIAASSEEARAIAARMAAPVMVKAQVLTGGRGKAGGVKLARNPDEAATHAERILGMSIKGIVVRRVLVSRAVDIAAEFYLGLALDRASKTVQCMASASGGMEIEEVAARTPERIVRFPVDPLRGSGGKDRVAALGRAFAGPGVVDQAGSVLEKMLRAYAASDCTLLEVNPLALKPGGRLVAADAKIVLDDNALYRHPELEKLRSSEEYSAEEMEAHAAGLSFVGLDGTIGCIVNGAGLSMATMDLIKGFGGSPANFLDVGGSSSPQKVLAALRIIFRNPRLAAVLINIFGGITRCDDVARGILLAREELVFPVPLVVRLIGTNEDEGRALLRDAGIAAYEDLSEAVRAVVAAAGARPGAGAAR
jgi:succinyl-CoA synthetase beta subunit